MAYYAFLDENNIVTEVIVGIDETELIEGLDPETWYGNFKSQKCLRTSYNTHGGEHPENKPFRKNYAGIGFIWDGKGFYPPQPFSSWTLNQDTYLWESPIPYDGTPENPKIWDESTLTWVEITK